MVAAVWKSKPQLEKKFIYHQQDRGSSVKWLKKPTTKRTDSQTKFTSQNPERRRPPDATASPQQLHCQCRESTAPAWRTDLLAGIRDTKSLEK